MSLGEDFLGRPPFFPFSREAFALFLLLIEPRATAAGFLESCFCMFHHFFSSFYTCFRADALTFYIATIIAYIAVVAS